MSGPLGGKDMIEDLGKIMATMCDALSSLTFGQWKPTILLVSKIDDKAHMLIGSNSVREIRKALDALDSDEGVEVQRVSGLDL